MTKPEHVEGICWCEDLDAREATLDKIYPDRCQIAGDMGTPHGLRRTCTDVAGHYGPCYGHLERRGGPCHFCGASFVGDWCTACWEDLEDISLADQKALFADIGLSLDVPKHVP